MILFYGYITAVNGMGVLPGSILWTLSEFDSRIGHHVVKSNRSVLIQVRRGVYVRVGHIAQSIELTLRSWFTLPTPLLVQGERSPWVDIFLLSCVRSTVLLVNSEQVVTPSRHG